jgi:uncharacterized protein (TIGR02688 family)
MDYWRHLTASGVRARLFDDEQVLVFLAAPDSVVADLERDGALAVSRDYLVEAFGVAPVARHTPREIARRLVQNLMLAEAAGRGGGEKFPYQDRLPESSVRERCLRFLSRWLEARTQTQTAGLLIREAEQDIPLGPWATTIGPIPDIQASLHVERALVQRIFTDLRTYTSLEERATTLADSLSVFRRHASHFWAVEREVPEWQALALAGMMAAGAQAALAELSDLRTAPEIVQAYVDRWWQVDVKEGLEHVKSVIAERFVRADEGELIKSRTRERRSMRLIDKVTVTYRETEDKYWAALANSGLTYVHIAPHLVQQYEKLLVGGVWANVEVRYDDSLQHRGITRPFNIEQLQPIQIASADVDEYIDGRRQFTRDEWIDVLIRSIGYEPTHADFSFRRKLLYLLRLVPMVEHNYNLVELGPRGTGKSFVFREISPYVILVSGGQVTVPKLFIENSPPYRIGLVGVWDVVAFDEVAGSQFRRPEEKQIYKDYMEMGSFSRGSGKGTIPAYASFVFNGNIDGDVETRARTSHLFTSFPESIRYDMAFHDRWHAYIPGWELPKMQPDYFTNHLGFIVDDLAEIFVSCGSATTLMHSSAISGSGTMPRSGTARPLSKPSRACSSCSIPMVSATRRSLSSI